MGFLKNEQDVKGINYVPGAPTTIKANSEIGAFIELGESFGSEDMTIQILKHVHLNGELVLYPFGDKKEKKVYHQLFFIDCDTNEVCSTLLKSYNIGMFKRLKSEIKYYNKVNDTKLDIEDFEVTMKFKDISKETTRGKFAIDFTFCKTEKGKPCRYVEIERNGIKVNEDAVVQKLSEEDFARNLDFYRSQENGDNLYDARLMDEVFDKNYDKTKYPEDKHFAIKMGFLYSLGVVSDSKSIELATKGSGAGLSLRVDFTKKLLQLT